MTKYELREFTISIIKPKINILKEVLMINLI